MPNILGILKGSGPAIQFIKSLMLSGVPADDVLAKVRASGYDIIPSTANLVINYLSRSVIPANLTLQNLPVDVLPTISSIPLSLTKTLRNFSYLVKVTGESAFGGPDIEQYVTVSTNSLLTQEQAIDVATGIVEGGSRYPSVNNASGEVQSISQNAGGLLNLDSILPAPGPVFTAAEGDQKEALIANRNYLKVVASGPVTPLTFSVSNVQEASDAISTLQAFIDKYSS